MIKSIIIHKKIKVLINVVDLKKLEVTIITTSSCIAAASCTMYLTF